MPSISRLVSLVSGAEPATMNNSISHQSCIAGLSRTSLCALCCSNTKLSSVRLRMTIPTTATRKPRKKKMRQPAERARHPPSWPGLSRLVPAMTSHELNNVIDARRKRGFPTTASKFWELPDLRNSLHADRESPADLGRDGPAAAAAAVIRAARRSQGSPGSAVSHLNSLFRHGEPFLRHQVFGQSN
jgi:hypothetical protein